MTVKLQTQGRGECWLVVACMLADYPLEKIRREIAEKFGFSWTQMIGRRGVRWRESMSKFVIERTGADQALLLLNWSRGDSIRRGPAPRLRIPEGRGALMLVKGPRKARFLCHVAVFDGGLVYDPMGTVYNGETFAGHYRGWRIDKVVQVPG